MLYRSRSMEDIWYYLPVLGDFFLRDLALFVLMITATVAAYQVAKFYAHKNREIEAEVKRGAPSENEAADRKAVPASRQTAQVSAIGTGRIEIPDADEHGGDEELTPVRSRRRAV